MRGSRVRHSTLPPDEPASAADGFTAPMRPSGDRRTVSLVVQLAGGLGNQLFQYAAGRAVAARSDVELALDDVGGFARDRRFRRRFELGVFGVRARIATRLERWVSSFDLLGRPLHGRRRLVRRTPWGDFVRETGQRHLPELAAFRASRPTWMKGYWQSPEYFEFLADELRAELDPPTPDDARIVGLGREVERRGAVAVGVRLYEETRDPASNARDGRAWSIESQAEAVHALLRAEPGILPLVFCTHRAQALERLRMPPETVFVTETEGYRGAVPNLWLLSRCRHHVFNNSTFYWWGAWLSEGRGPADARRRIVASDSFINVDGLPARWERF